MALQKVKTICTRLGYDAGVTWVFHCSRGGSANDAARAAQKKIYGNDDEPDLNDPKIIAAIQAVTGHTTVTSAKGYAKSQSKREQEAAAREMLIANNKVVMRLKSKAFVKKITHETEGRVMELPQRYFALMPAELRAQLEPKNAENKNKTKAAPRKGAGKKK